MQERDINLFDLVADILLHWRSIIVAMLIGAVLMGGFSYAQSYRASKVQESKQETQVSKEGWEAKLSTTQLNNVKYVLGYEKLYRDKLAYCEQSVLMQLDSNAVQTAEVTFLVDSDDMDLTYNIVKAYEDIVRSGELFEIIAVEMEMITSNASEVISLEKESYSLLEGTDTLRLKLVHYDKYTCQEMMQMIIDYLDEKSIQLKRLLGDHEISVLTQSLISVADADIASRQKTQLAELISLEDTVIKNKEAFSDTEWQYYDLMLNGKITDLSVTKVAEVELESVVSGEVTGESAADDIDKVVIVQPVVSMKYVVLGAILAAFVYVFAIFVLYILNTKVRVNDNLQNIYMIPQLGLIAQSDKSKKLLGFVDDWIISLRDKNKRKFAKEEAVGLATVAVKMAAGKESLDTIYLVGCDLTELALDVCERIKVTLNKDGINAVILNNILYDAQAMNELESAQGVVLVEKAGSTLYTEIAQEIELLKRQEINVLGGIIVE